MFNAKNKRKTSSRANGFYGIIISGILVIACAPNTKQIMYFKEPKHKIEESYKHIHGIMASPHFLPINKDKVSGEIVHKYNLLYSKTHHKTRKTINIMEWGCLILLTLILTTI